MATRPPRAARPALLVYMPDEMKHDLALVAWRRNTSMTKLLREHAENLIEEDKAEQASQRKAGQAA